LNYYYIYIYIYIYTLEKFSDKAILFTLDGKKEKSKYNFVCNLHKFLNYQHRERSTGLVGKHCE